MECNYSKIKSIGVFFSGPLMVLVSYFCVILSPGIGIKILGWTGVCLFSFYSLRNTLNLFKQGKAFIVNEKGIEDLRTKWGFIPWFDIVYVSIGVLRSERFLCIEVKDPDKYLSRISAWQRFSNDINKLFGVPMISVFFYTLTPGLDEVWGYIRSNHPDKIKL